MSATPPSPMLGIDLGGTKVEALLLSAQGHELWRLRVPTPSGAYTGTLQAMAGLVAQAGPHAGSEFTIGIGTPGAADPNGLMKNCNSTCLNGRPLQADLQALLQRPVALANDANCLALSEATDGAGAGAEVVFAAILGTGAGAGIAVHGRVLTGPNAIAGEWGHNPLPWRDATSEAALGCYCGKTGCIEGFVSGSGLAQQHLQVNGELMRGEELVSRARRGDQACTESLRRHAGQLARALASVINLLDPDVIVLGGGLSRMEHLYAEVPALWERWVFSAGSGQAVRTRLVTSMHGDASGVRGAAWVGRASGASRKTQQSVTPS